MNELTTRSTTTRDRHRKAIKRERPDCGICEQPIDYDLPYLDPMSYVVDHIVPWNKGGTDELDNKQAAHRTCNRLKSDKDAGDIAQRRMFITTRTW